MKSLLVVIATGVALVLGTASPAAAAAPCWKQLINDWYDGKIDNVYAPTCYRQAIDHLPQDVSTYSSAKDDIERALQAALRHGPNDPGNPGGGNGTGNGTGTGNSTNGPSGSSSEGSGKGVITRAIEWLGPSNAASVPLPLLILAGVAFLLLAAAGGSFLNRRFRTRRLPPPES